MIIRDKVEIPAPGVFSTYSANFGVGYGSNASLGRESRASTTARTRGRSSSPKPAWSAGKRRELHVRFAEGSDPRPLVPTA
ncbi:MULTISPECIES: hypothetical protein [unclassified Streptomyces]|uniref:hypothetical protein n=1 Tax=unclassified Streptomyces TaxID=2593676 RepID=UPI002DDABCE1|nr:hypothetical protein [Streptomyces sp. NBC_01750]WSA99242.1 hypothetical protein OIE54_08195 [Streptomyces sp. NBC_01794]WSD36192.1 hypothetical protein OG966_32380 [Streptomyces sp. NBC_01750]